MGKARILILSKFSTTRIGRTIIFCPQRDSAEGTTIDSLHMVFTYLHAIPSYVFFVSTLRINIDCCRFSDEVKERGFVVIVDMRGAVLVLGPAPLMA